MNISIQLTHISIVPLNILHWDVFVCQNALQINHVTSWTSHTQLFTLFKTGFNQTEARPFMDLSQTCWPHYLQTVPPLCTAVIVHNSTGETLPEFSLEIILSTLLSQTCPWHSSSLAQLPCQGLLGSPNETEAISPMGNVDSPSILETESLTGWIWPNCDSHDSSFQD